MWFYGKTGWYYVDSVNRVWSVIPGSGYPTLSPLLHHNIRLHCKPAPRRTFWASRAEKMIDEIVENRRLAFIRREQLDVVSR